MPQYKDRLTLPSLTPSSAPLKTAGFYVLEKTLTSLEVYFPTGCAGLAAIQVTVNGKVIFPATSSGDPWARG